MVLIVQQLKEFDGKTLKFAKNDGLDLVEEDWKKKLEGAEIELELLTKLMKKVIEDKVEKATSERQNRRFHLAF